MLIRLIWQHIIASGYGHGISAWACPASRTVVRLGVQGLVDTERSCKMARDRSASPSAIPPVLVAAAIRRRFRGRKRPHRPGKRTSRSPLAAVSVAPGAIMVMPAIGMLSASRYIAFPVTATAIGMGMGMGVSRHVSGLGRTPPTIVGAAAAACREPEREHGGREADRRLVFYV